MSLRAPPPVGNLPRPIPEGHVRCPLNAHGRRIRPPFAYHVTPEEFERRKAVRAARTSWSTE